MVIDLLHQGGRLIGQGLMIKKSGHIPKVEGEIPEKGAQIFVANHLPEYQGPVAIVSAIPYRVYSWASDVFMDRKECINDFQEGLFKRRYGDTLLTNVMGAGFGTVFSTALNITGAVPVYRDKETDEGTKRTQETYIESAIKLNENKTLLIFPELMKGKPDSLGLYDEFKFGFARAAEFYFLFGADYLDYYAMAVCQDTGNVKIAPCYRVYKEDFIKDDPKTRFNRKQLKEDLEKKIREMCAEMD